MRKVLAIAQNTFKEAIRNRILYVVLVFAILFILAGFVVKDLTIAAHGDVIRKIGLSVISIVSLLLALLIGIGLVYNELDKKTIYTIVSKPIDRWQFLLGKYIGLLLTLYLVVTLMTLVFCGEMWLLNRQLQEADFNIIMIKSLKAIFLGCLELAVVVAFALLFSSFSTPVLSGFMTLMMWIAGRANEDIERFAEKVVTDAGGTQEQSRRFFEGLRIISENGDAGFGDQVTYLLAKIVALLAPNFEIFYGIKEAIHFDTVDANTLVLIVRDTSDAVLYCIPYTISVLLIAMFLFGRRNFR